MDEASLTLHSISDVEADLTLFYELSERLVASVLVGRVLYTCAPGSVEAYGRNIIDATVLDRRIANVVTEAGLLGGECHVVPAPVTHTLANDITAERDVTCYGHRSLEADVLVTAARDVTTKGRVLCEVGELYEALISDEFALNGITSLRFVTELRHVAFAPVMDQGRVDKAAHGCVADYHGTVEKATVRRFPAKGTAFSDRKGERIDVGSG